MNHQCHQCGESTLGHYVCTLTGNHYVCEHPQWMANESYRNIAFQAGPLAHRLEMTQNTHWHKLSLRLKDTLKCGSVLMTWIAMPWCLARYQNAEWGAVVKTMQGEVHVYSLIPYAECLLYQQWEHAAPDDAGHIAVWPKYPFEGHKP